MVDDPAKPAVAVLDGVCRRVSEVEAPYLAS